MDKSVRRVTLVEGSGENRVSKVVYDATENDDGTPRMPDLSKLEAGVRHMLKAQMVAAQEAYKQHMESAAKEGNSWLRDAPGNFFKAREKAMEEMSKVMPFGKNDEKKEG